MKPIKDETIRLNKPKEPTHEEDRARLKDWDATIKHLRERLWHMGRPPRHGSIPIDLVPDVPDDLRELGWTVAIHNDYKLGPDSYTFWLLTRGNHCVKGEGRTDAEALNVIREKISSAFHASDENVLEALKNRLLMQSDKIRLLEAAAVESEALKLRISELEESVACLKQLPTAKAAHDPDCPLCGGIGEAVTSYAQHPQDDHRAPCLGSSPASPGSNAVMEYSLREGGERWHIENRDDLVSRHRGFPNSIGVLDRKNVEVCELSLAGLKREDVKGIYRIAKLISIAPEMYPVVQALAHEHDLGVPPVDWDERLVLLRKRAREIINKMHE